MVINLKTKYVSSHDALKHVVQIMKTLMKNLFLTFFLLKFTLSLNTL